MIPRLELWGDLSINGGIVIGVIITILVIDTLVIINHFRKKRNGKSIHMSSL